jgi:hypothetical protein
MEGESKSSSFEKNTTTIRVSYCRFYKDKPVGTSDEYDRVVTVVWTFNYDKYVINYGANVFNKSPLTPVWYKKASRVNAYDNFTTKPLRIGLDDTKFAFHPEMTSRALYWYIARCLVNRHGCYNTKNHDTRRLHDVEVVYPTFNQSWDPFYKENKPLFKGGKNAKTLGKKVKYTSCGFILGILISQTGLWISNNL